MVKKKRRKLKIGRLVFVLLLFIILVLGFVGFVGYNYIMYKVDSVGTTNLMILGLDLENDNTQRNDAIMLATIVPKEGEISLLSIPRDSYLPVPCLNNEYDKITHAFAFGSKACTIEAVSNLFEIELIDKYVTLDFNQMISLIDTMGGITISPSKTFCQKGVSPDSTMYCFTEGVPVEVNGAGALAYSRQRNVDSDIYRAMRQQEIIFAMIEKVKSLDILEVISLLEDGLEIVDTNLTFLELAAFYKTSTHEDFIINRVELLGSDSYQYSAGNKTISYVYEIDDNWLDDYQYRLKLLLEK